MSAGLAAKRAFASAATAKMQIATVSGTMKDPASTMHENHTRPRLPSGKRRGGAHQVQRVGGVRRIFVANDDPTE